MLSPFDVVARVCRVDECAPRILYDGEKHFWKTNAVINIKIAEHFKFPFSCIEIAAINPRTLEEATHIFLNSRMLYTVVVRRDKDLKGCGADSVGASSTTSYAQLDGNRGIFIGDYQELACRFILNRIIISNDAPLGSFQVALRPLFCDDNLRGDLPMKFSMEIPKPFNLVAVNMAVGTISALKW
jgi:hypothetical protein